MKKMVDPLLGINGIHEKGILGQGIGIAVLDTGIYMHRDFYRTSRKLYGFVDYVRGKRIPYDDHGHGTHVCGLLVSEHRKENGETVGVAPGASLYVIKVLDYAGNGKVYTMLKGMQWILEHYKEYGIRIVNISVGMPLDHDTMPENNILVQKVEELWNAGLVVIVAAGNEGPKAYSITSPGVSRKVITVGALELEGDGEKRELYSGVGPVPYTCVCKPDLIAPATDILSCDNRGEAYLRRSGTSMAAPLVSGAAALLLSKEPNLSNRDVKYRMMRSCIDMGQEKNRQGWGMLSIPDLLSSF